MLDRAEAVNIGNELLQLCAQCIGSYALSAYLVSKLLLLLGMH